MKLSYNWLKQYLDFDYSPEDLSDVLTMTGLEVEGFETFESIPGGLKGIVVGEVKICEKHPNADKLSVCKVDVGAEELLGIVCGAPNVATGQKVAVATVGTMLYPIEGEPFKIKKAKIRGEASQGMICAEDELGLGKSHDGIIVLDAAAKIGSPANEIFDIEIDHIYEIGLTANRADATSHFGASRDIAAVLRKHSSLPEVPAAILNASATNPISIEIQNTEMCGRYVGIYIKGIEVKESPDWIKHRLKAIGLRPINNIVDITNYVLHELGQPLHAFDADKIAGNKIVVKPLEKDSKFSSLDETERAVLGGKDLMICDGEKPIAIAGVMGGLNSEVSDSTQNIFLESAWFDPVTIRRTAKRLILNSDASYRFERGVDPNMTLLAAQRAAALIAELAGGEVSKATDVKERDFPHFEVAFNIDRSNIVMGTDFSQAEITEILECLDIQVTGEENGTLALKVPPYRVDVQRPQDVMEEILRIHGYNNVPFPEETSFSLSTAHRNEEWKVREKYFDFLAGSGFREILTNSLVSEKYASDSTVNLINNLSEELAVMRSNLLVTALDVIEYNHQRRNFDLKFFEFGKVYRKDGDQYSEAEKIGIYLTGNQSPEHWEGKSKSNSLFSLTKEIEQLARWFKFDFTVKESSNELLDYGLDIIVNDKVIGSYGRASDKYTSGRDLKGDFLFAELDWKSLSKLHRKRAVTFGALPKFPSMMRDVSMIVPEQLSFQEIRKVILPVNKKLIRSVGITDIYKGDKIEEGKKSYLVNIEMRDDEKTLNDKAADKIMDRVFKVLEEVGAEVRK